MKKNRNPEEERNNKTGHISRNPDHPLDKSETIATMPIATLVEYIGSRKSFKNSVAEEVFIVLSIGYIIGFGIILIVAQLYPNILDITLQTI